METWIANLAGSYSIHRTDKHDVQALAGTRCFSLVVGTELDASVIPGGTDLTLNAVAQFCYIYDRGVWSWDIVI